jgi:hypothetical protein
MYMTEFRIIKEQEEISCNKKGVMRDNKDRASIKENEKSKDMILI